ncbi:MAG: hypothetical protein F2839_00390 [Actinobacteria bacterium]|nr:hypothetical protein [Actinomycetota bacterium]
MAIFGLVDYLAPVHTSNFVVLISMFFPTTLISYWSQTRFVWDYQDRFRRGYPRFIATNLVSFALNWMLLEALSFLGDLTRFQNQLICVPIVVVVVFILNKFWAFA